MLTYSSYYVLYFQGVGCS